MDMLLYVDDLESQATARRGVHELCHGQALCISVSRSRSCSGPPRLLSSKLSGLKFGQLLGDVLVLRLPQALANRCLITM